MNRNKKEIILQIATLLSQLIEEKEEKPPVVPTSDNKIEMLTVKECTEVVKGLSEHTVRQLVAQKKISYIRTGQGKRGKILVSKDSLLSYLGGAA